MNLNNLEKTRRKSNNREFFNGMIMNFLFQITFVITCIAFSFSTVLAKPICTVKGRIVDGKGEPVGTAFVLLASNNPLFVSDLIGVGTEADDEGFFILKFACAKTKKPKSLYVTSPILRSVKHIILPPFELLRENDPLYSGIPVLLKRDKVIDIGEVKLQIQYAVVKLALTDKSGKQFFTNKEQWSGLWIKIENDKGVRVGDEGMSVENYRDHTEADASALRIALPEGKWSVELFPEGRDGKFVARKLFTVIKTDSPVKVNLVVEDKQ